MSQHNTHDTEIAGLLAALAGPLAQVAQANDLTPAGPVAMPEPRCAKCGGPRELVNAQWCNGCAMALIRDTPEVTSGGMAGPIDGDADPEYADHVPGSGTALITHLHDDGHGGVWQHPGLVANCPAPECYRDPNCPRCNTDRHQCPGCGKPLSHRVDVCSDCASIRDSGHPHLVPDSPDDPWAQTLHCHKPRCRWSIQVSPEDADAALNNFVHHLSYAHKIHGDDQHEDLALVRRAIGAWPGQPQPSITELALAAGADMKAKLDAARERIDNTSTPSPVRAVEPDPTCQHCGKTLTADDAKGWVAISVHGRRMGSCRKSPTMAHQLADPGPEYDRSPVSVPDVVQPLVPPGPGVSSSLFAQASHIDHGVQGLALVAEHGPELPRPSNWPAPADMAPAPEPGRIDLTDVGDWVATLRQAREDAKAAKERETEAMAILVARFPEAARSETAYVDGQPVMRRDRKSGAKRWDTKRLAAEHPELESEYRVQGDDYYTVTFL